MNRVLSTAICGIGLAFAGCVRLGPQEAGPIQLTNVCPLHRAPQVAEFPKGGVRAAYQFVVQDASPADKAALLGETGKRNFALVPMTINLNGVDTWFAQGVGVLTNQAMVDAEFNLACSMRQGPIVLVHVRYNPADGSNGDVQLR